MPSALARAAVLPLGGAALALSACDVASRGPVPVVEAYQVTDEILEMRVDSCNGSPSASVTEGETEDGAVHVFVVALVQGAEDACLDTVLVELDSPLGDRALIDDYRAEEIAVEPAAAP